jgi:hypothetical protein
MLVEEMSVDEMLVD